MKPQAGESERGGQEAEREVEGGQGDKERWARLDSWWAMEGMKVEMVDRVNTIPVDFSQHRGVAVEWTMEDVTILETTYQQLRKLPPREDALWEKFRGWCRGRWRSLPRRLQ